MREIILSDRVYLTIGLYLAVFKKCQNSKNLLEFTLQITLHRNLYAITGGIMLGNTWEKLNVISQKC